MQGFLYYNKVYEVVPSAAKYPLPPKVEDFCVEWFLRYLGCEPI